MEELVKRLNALPRSYYDFVKGISSYCRKKESRLEKVMAFLDANTEATPSDVIEFVSMQDDFFENAAPYHETAV
ncbi:MAG: hypothetical protein K6F92_06520 [Lachnospiraceae bacterium]|nr:hypothetical protein [Lachnospiraceae bacterium]